MKNRNLPRILLTTAFILLTVTGYLLLYVFPSMGIINQLRRKTLQIQEQQVELEKRYKEFQPVTAAEWQTIHSPAKEAPPSLRPGFRVEEIPEALETLKRIIEKRYPDLSIAHFAVPEPIHSLRRAGGRTTGYSSPFGILRDIPVHLTLKTKGETMPDLSAIFPQNSFYTLLDSLDYRPLGKSTEYRIKVRLFYRDDKAEEGQESLLPIEIDPGTLLYPVLPARHRHP